MKPLIISCLTFILVSNIVFTQEKYTQKIQGTISDSLTNQTLSKAQIVLYDINKEDFYNLQQGNEIIHQNTKIHQKKVYTSNESGDYSFSIESGKYYNLIVTINGFVTQTKLFETIEFKPLQTFNFSLKNQEVYTDSENKYLVKVAPIQFEINSSKIDKKSKKELNKVVMLLKKYSDFEVEIGVHSSSLGNDAFGLKLTTKRANAIFNYITSFNWQNKERLTAVGYGKTNPINNCGKEVKCELKKHNKNKRVEFVIKSNYKPTSNFEYLNREIGANYK
ncbi:OmpA family protein [Lutibacter sp. TH_r2]|uniref:OmpA family protein n=1 Tax=Lutibacter sp. TH_r2 TaxID=3082083 RepID=UPI002955AD79|nr:OmpA family protein [Lutibacter sp. TH_r2]MDV7186427.1 OmpA family protein [Lutibacter sp. TH_r2]